MHKLISTAVTSMTALMCSVSIAAAQSVPDPVAAAPAGAAGDLFLTGPPNDGGPVVVRASFELGAINNIDDAAETFELDGILTLTWRDERQAFDPAALGVDEKLYQGAYQFTEAFTGWFPQVVIVNEVVMVYEFGVDQAPGVVLRVQPDGTLTLVKTVEATAKAHLALRRYPFDRQRLDVRFEVLGADAAELVLRAEPEGIIAPDPEVRVPQWTISGVRTSIENRHTLHARRQHVASTFVVSTDVQRRSFFMVRLVVLPLILIVMLSWSVFWMERSSLGDRMSISFIGILTAVAYQSAVSDILPPISYLTLMHGFLNISFLVMAATVVINLAVDALDRKGKSEVGDRVDRRCRWIFPVTYFGLLLVTVGVAFLFF